MGVRKKNCQLPCCSPLNLNQVCLINLTQLPASHKCLQLATISDDYITLIFYMVLF